MYKYSVFVFYEFADYNLSGDSQSQEFLIEDWRTLAAVAVHAATISEGMGFAFKSTQYGRHRYKTTKDKTATRRRTHGSSVPKANGMEPSIR
jgi:hypothetical protein